MSQIQVVRHVQSQMTQKTLSTACFYGREGRVMLATNTVFNYQLQRDKDCIIHNAQ